MNISFDVLPLISENMSGIGYCQAGLVGEMIRSHPEDRYTFDYFHERIMRLRGRDSLHICRRTVPLMNHIFPDFYTEA